MAAALGMQEAVVRRLLEAGAGVDDVNREGLSALDMAVSTGNTEITRMLLERSPQLDRINAVGYTPLYIAVQTDYPDLVRALLAAGADPNIAVSDPHPLSGLTPLMCAVLHKNHGIAGLLLQAGADVNHVTANGRDALLFAVQRNDPRMVNRLSRADAKPCSTPPGERSAFQEAVESGQHDMVEFMLRHAKTYPCPTPLLMDALKRAIYRGDLRMTSLLLEHGAPVDQEAQAAALGLAIKLGHDSIADLLRRHGDGERQPSCPPASAPDQAGKPGRASSNALSAGPASCCKPRCGAHGIGLPCHAIEVVGRNTPKGHSAIRGPGKVFEMTFPVCDPRCNALRVLHPTNR